MNGTDNSIKKTIIGIDSPMIKKIIESTPKDQLILDLDIDYFATHLDTDDNFLLEDRGFTKHSDILHHDIKKIKKMLEQVGLITVATSPGFIEQNSAIELIHQIFPH